MSDDLQVDLIVQAIDRASAVMQEVASNTENLNKKTQEQTQTTQRGESAMTTFNQALGVANQVMAAGRAIWDGSIGSSLAYVDSVRQVSAETGMGAEATSHMMDLTDNFGISTSNLTMAQKKLSSEGLSLTIGTLKDLADQYNTLDNQADKSQFLVQNLGKAGFQFAAMFAAGSGAMQDYYSNATNGMVVTEKQTADALKLQIAQKDLGDAWQGTVNKMVTPVIPQITDYLNKVQEYSGVNGGADVNGVTQALNLFGALGAAAVDKVGEAFGIYKQPVTAATQAIEAHQAAMMKLNGEAGLTEEQLTALHASQSAEIGMAAQIASQDAAYAATQSTLAQKISETTSALQHAVSVGYSPAGKTIMDLKGNLESLNQQYDANKQKNQENTNALALSDYMKIQSSKDMTTEMYKQEEQVEVALGISTQAQADEAVKMRVLDEQMAAGTITATRYADALKHIADAPAAKSGQDQAAAWAETAKAQADAAAKTKAAMAYTGQPIQADPTNGTGGAASGTGQGAAAAWAQQQSQAKAQQETNKKINEEAQKNFDNFAQGIAKSAQTAADKVNEVMGAINKLAGLGTVNVNGSITVTGTGNTGAPPEYP